MLVTFVPVEEILDLRQEVLRPGQPRESALTEVDMLPDTFHLAARTDGGELAACATFSTEPLPDTPSLAPFVTEGVWRLRKMASAPQVRGRGYGGAVLRAGLDACAMRGGRLVWCSGRLAAAGFYQRHGFTPVGDQYTVPGIGRHHHFVHRLP
ncbi:GNAT family N-acetyltransferase [Streptomyces sp. NPDC051546]|uniref:GNAT family N-acetyltransferase n=1 Tax=Streptomyces sp. NPDC051546 TaxID=3365655 RepID=UPI0037884CC9